MFGLSIDPRFIEVQSRRLAAPKVHYHRDQQGKMSLAQMSGTGGSWNLRNRQVYQSTTLVKWRVLGISLNRDIDLRPGWEELKRQLFSLGIRHNDPDGFSVMQLSRSTEAQRLQGILNGLTSCKKARKDFVLVVLDEAVANSSTYSMIKYVGDFRVGIPTSCVVFNPRKKFGGTSPQYYGNVAIKINLKLGGINQALPATDGALDVLHKEDTMIVGIDVTHPAPDSAFGTPSIASVVASCDSFFAHYPASIKLNPRRQERVDLLREMVEERLETFKRHNSKMPKNILVYRDGVGESQYEMVHSLEGGAIDAAVGGKCLGAKVTIVVVGKRHHTRFFKPNNFGELANPSPGTMVDRDVTMENGFDFFLQAHDALKGTAKPAHYVVIRNDMKIGLDSLQKMVSPVHFLLSNTLRT